MSKIGVISDTHNCLREPVQKLLQGCDAIIHAGDFCNDDTFRRLQDLAPLYAVLGNADKRLSDPLPQTLSFQLFGLNIFLIHNKNAIPKTELLSNKDLIIYGHSHKYEQQRLNGQIWLNPGSCGVKRFRLPVTMALIHIKNDDGHNAACAPDEKIDDRFESERFESKCLGFHFDIERIDLSKNQPDFTSQPPENIRTVVQNVMKDVDKGKNVSAIAKKNRINIELAECICRLYLTHPGVNADGILKKMGL